MQLNTAEGEVFTVDLYGPENAKQALLLIHDWWGGLEYNHNWAKRFAEMGFRCMVPDLFDGHHPQDTKAAGEFVRTLDQDVASRKLQACLQALSAKNRKIAVLGWSFGGLQAQHATLNNPDLVSALVMFYCRILLNRHNVDKIAVPVLSIFAETERTWPDKQADLEQLMAEYDKPLECQSYDASHGFANPDSLNYDSDACEASWAASADFLARYLG